MPVVGIREMSDMERCEVKGSNVLLKEEDIQKLDHPVIQEKMRDLDHPPLGGPDPEKTKAQCLDEYVRISALREEIHQSIQAFRDNFKDELDGMDKDLARLQFELVELTKGEAYKHPDGVAELKVKKGRQTFGTDVQIDRFDDEGVATVLGPPSTWLVEVPATWTPRTMAETRRLMELKGLNDDARRLLLDILDVRVGDPKITIKIHEVLIDVEAGIEAEKGGE